MRLIAKRSLAYARKRMSAGDEFDASDKDARLLMLVGHASEVIEELPQKAKVKRKYKRRDMTAEA